MSATTLHILGFPLDFVPTLDWRPPAVNPHGVGGRHFGARRPNGRRHAGCDLIAPEGSNVYAVANGTVLYQGPFAISYLPGVHVREISIDHGTFVARYCELGSVAHGLNRGSRVVMGQVIGTVGRMVNDAMLHFELYEGTETGPLSRPGNATDYAYVDAGPYYRRRDLLDPTEALDTAQCFMPSRP